MKTKNMKRAVLTALAAAMVVCTFPACTSNRIPATAEERAQRMGTVAELATFTGATLWLAENPEDRARFVMALNGIEVLLLAGNGTPEQLTEVLQQLPIAELKSKEGALLLGTATILYDAYLREQVNLDSTAFLQPVIIGIHAGLSRALAGADNN